MIYNMVMPEIFDASVSRNETAESLPAHKPASAASHEKKPAADRCIDDYSSVMRKERPSGHPFSAYAAKPLNTSFDIQAGSEMIVLLLRQHPITQLKWLFMAVVMFLLPMLFSMIGLLAFLPVRFQVMASLGWYLISIGFVLQSFIKWYYNVYIVTDERIIDIDFHSMIFKDISAAKIDKIEDTTASTGGFAGSLFDYGTITIQTAAEKREFEFEDVPHPSRVSKLINEMILEEEREQLEGRVH